MAFKMKGWSPLKHGTNTNGDKPHTKFKTETEHEEYHDVYPTKDLSKEEVEQQRYEPPKIIHDTRYREEASYSPESATIRMGGGTYGLLSQEELTKIENHETKHHHQVYERGVEGHRKKDTLDFEKWFKENTDFKETTKMTEKEYSDYRDNMSEKWQKEQYNVEGSNEYEAMQAEDKHSPGLMKEQ
tara:strand:+ start:134 stop:691 length:558 start_codon:yes stop_codon:yes gene_type:complete